MQITQLFDLKTEPTMLLKFEMPISTKSSHPNVPARRCPGMQKRRPVLSKKEQLVPVHRKIQKNGYVKRRW